MRRLLVLVLLMSTLAACGSDEKPDKTTLTVFAAASLNGTFTEIGKQFEAKHDDVTVRFNFGGSADLVAQLGQGAPADVFASADTANMDKATAADLVAGEPRDFATNSLEIATPPENPAAVRSLDDLSRAALKVVLCAAEVPCGAVAHEVERRSGIEIKPVSEEQSVTDVLGKVISGEADAGLVYVTDVKASGDAVKGIGFPESSAAVNTYPIAIVKDTKTADLAQAFVDFVTGSTGRGVLDAAGFGTP